MTPRTLLRLVLVTLGAVALGGLGAAALGAGEAGAITAPALGPGLAPSPPDASGAGPSLGLGPIAVDLPAAPAPGEPAPITVPVPLPFPAAPPELPVLPLIPAVLALSVPTGPDLTSVPGPAPLLPAARLATPAPTDVSAPRGARSLTPTPTPAGASSEAVPTGGAPGGPSVPLTPWTLALAGAVLVSAATDGHRPGDGPSFVAVVSAARRVTARLVGSLTLLGSGPSRPGSRSSSSDRASSRLHPAAATPPRGCRLGARDAPQLKGASS